jgi:hypothetical protein
MDELRNFTLAKLYTKIDRDEDDTIFIEWFQSLGLLHSIRTCECGEKMGTRKARDSRSYPKWQCPKRNCRKERGFLVGTFFEGMHLELREVSSILFFQSLIWVLGLSIVVFLVSRNGQRIVYPVPDAAS